MTDVLKIALDRRAELHEEVAKLDEFIRMAESLIRASQTRQAEDQPADAAADTRSVAPERPAAVPTDESSVRAAMRRADATGPQMSVDVSRPSLIRRGQAIS
ncbi:MAG: hypothetical protein AAGD13_12330 [Pseudomonadota bacterium]